jgi:hypothetical protein
VAVNDSLRFGTSSRLNHWYLDDGLERGEVVRKWMASGGGGGQEGRERNRIRHERFFDDFLRGHHGVDRFYRSST